MSSVIVRFCFLHPTVPKTAKLPTANPVFLIKLRREFVSIFDTPLS